MCFDAFFDAIGSLNQYHVACAWCNRIPTPVPRRLCLMQSNPCISSMSHVLDAIESLKLTWWNSCHLVTLRSSGEALIIWWSSCHLMELLSSHATLVISWNSCHLEKLLSSHETLVLLWNLWHLESDLIKLDSLSFRMHKFLQSVNFTTGFGRSHCVCRHFYHNICSLAALLESQRVQGPCTNTTRTP